VQRGKGASGFLEGGIADKLSVRHHRIEPAGPRDSGLHQPAPPRIRRNDVREGIPKIARGRSPLELGKHGDLTTDRASTRRVEAELHDDSASVS
jgi:hypothetical protein